MLLRVRQTIEINKMPVCYNGRGEDGEGGFVHYFTSKLPGKETTFVVPRISARTLSKVVGETMSRYADVAYAAASTNASRALASASP
jgi:hypothetical protein